MCAWTRLAAATITLALVLAAILRAQGFSAPVAIMLITAALTAAQTLYWALVCNGFRR